MTSREVDVVMTVSPRTDLESLLTAWKSILEAHHLIMVIEEDYTDNEEEQKANLQNHHLLHDLDCQIFTKRDAESFLMSLEMSSSQKTSITLDSILLNPFTGSACTSFGFLVSRARYIVSFTDDVVPAKNSISGTLVDSVQQHLDNLRTKSAPYYFNTLYDPFIAGSCGFVRGYPFSLRLGVPTAVSHGLSLGLPDYDAPTSIVKPQERTLRYVDTVVTVPKGALFPMSATNFAFDRRLIGPCMLLRLGIGVQDLMNNSSSSSSTNIDDVWAGLCAKVVSDHLGYGVKTGIPYVWRGAGDEVSKQGTRNAASALASLKTEFRPLLLLEDILPFFQTLRLRNMNTVEDCYLEIARTVKGKLRTLDPSFERVAAVMKAWIEAWKATNASSASSLVVS